MTTATYTSLQAFTDYVRDYAMIVGHNRPVAAHAGYSSFVMPPRKLSEEQSAAAVHLVELLTPVSQSDNKSAALLEIAAGIKHLLRAKQAPEIETARTQLKYAILDSVVDGVCPEESVNQIMAAYETLKSVMREDAKLRQPVAIRS